MPRKKKANTLNLLSFVPRIPPHSFAMNPTASNGNETHIVGHISESEETEFAEQRTDTAKDQKRSAGVLDVDQTQDLKRQKTDRLHGQVGCSSSELHPKSTHLLFSTASVPNDCSTNQQQNDDCSSDKQDLLDHGFADVNIQNDGVHCDDNDHCEVHTSPIHPTVPCSGEFFEKQSATEADHNESNSGALSNVSSVSSFQCPPAPPTTPIVDVHAYFESMPRRNSGSFHDISTPKPLSASALPHLPADDAMDAPPSALGSQSTASILEEEKHHEKKSVEKTGNGLRRRQCQLSNDFDSWKVGPRYELMRILGKGSYGEVAQAKDLYFSQEGNPKYVAIKKIATDFEQEVDALHSFREIHLLRRLKGHDCIIQLIDVVAPETVESFVGDIYLVFEYVDTDLYKLIMSPQYLTTAHIQTFLYQMLKGLKFLHSSSVIHRDLKPANILINEDCSLKICDFGLARIVSSDQVAKGNDYISNSDNATSSSNRSSSLNPPTLTRQLTKHVVTRWYRAPELILIQPYTTAVDIWSVGCIFAELLSMQQESVPSYEDRVPLFPGGSCFPLSGNLETKSSERLDQLSVIFGVIGMPCKEDLDSIGSANEYIKKLEMAPTKTLESLYPGADSRAIDLLKKMLQFNPSKRCTADEALEHEFLACVRQKAMETTSNRPLIGPDFLNSDKIDVEEVKRKTLEELLWFKKSKLN